MINLSLVRVKQSLFQEEGSYIDKKTGENKKRKSRWVVEISYVQSSYSKLLGQTVWRERTDEIESECEIANGDWLVEIKTAYEKTVIVKVIGKSDFNLLLPANKQPAPAKGEK